MESEIERLRIMLDAQDVWGKPVESAPTQDASLDVQCTHRPDEKFPPYGNDVEDFLKHPMDAVEDFPQYALQTGQTAPAGELFCPLTALIKYPYVHIAAVHRDSVANGFFAKGCFYKQPWDLFYIYPPSSIGRKAILLVPLRQFKRFLAIINEKLETELKLPENAADIGLVVDFPTDETPSPRYLGHTMNPEVADGLKQAVPSMSWRPDGEIECHRKPSAYSLEAFSRKLELLLDSEKKKKAAAREKKRLERVAKQQCWNHLIKRVQRYLGIRASRQGRDVAPNVPGRSSKRDIAWSKPGQTVEATALHLNTPAMLDVEKPGQFDPEGSVIFISIDVEAFERDHNLVTEIGIATLDMAEVAMMSPGKGGINWMNAIRARHFRVKEYKHLNNREFINGCAEHFQFGQSEWISIKTAAYDISKCFKFPYSKQTTSSSVGQENSLDISGMDTKRNIILVGHDISTDINYLRKLGYDPYNLANLRELVDTSSMYRALEREPNPRNLGSILASLDIAGWYLHNAGNDAVYTLQAMIGIAIKAMMEKPDQQSWAVETEARIAESAKIAAENTLEAHEGWSSDGGDGGSPVAPRAQGPSKGSSGEQKRDLQSPWRSTISNDSYSKANSK